MSRLLRILMVMVVAGVLAGCATQSASIATPPDAHDSRVERCRDLYRTLDAQVAEAGVADAQASRVAGFPYLRVNRFLAADGVKPDAGSAAFALWVERLRDLDLEARRFELANLRGDTDDAEQARLEACSELLIAVELDLPSARTRLLDAARVPDDYSVAKRVIGLYPFTSLPFNAGVRNLHEKMQTDFTVPLASLPVTGRVQRYLPPSDAGILSTSAVAKLIAPASGAPSGLVKISEDARQRLRDTFAPVFEIDVAGDDDRIGTPYWSEDAKPSVDVTRPVVYFRIAHTRFGGRSLPQLVYSVWFPSRPSDGAFDLLSGRLDGITFRVTLDVDGRPLVYDSVHNCGCYHLFVPTGKLKRKPPPRGHEEPPFVPQQVDDGAGRLVLRIAHGNHYLQRLYFDASPDPGEIYTMRDYDALRSLPRADGSRRSLFDPDGLVAGTERGERWLFWPMGIAEPGAMRQWGRHATAFVGTRHFDDADLMERYFERAQPSL